MTEAHHRALERLGDDAWNSFLHVEREPQQPGALVVSLKDNLALAGRPMTCGSKHLADHVAPYDATVVERLRAHGDIVLLGKTNMDEFAAGSSGENSAFGPTRNPRDPARAPGGSSSGAGASVASGVCDAAIGSDTGGSIRCPAAFCGAVALKPTRGLVSRYGMADLAMSLESPAPLAKDTRTLARIMDVIAGEDPRDPVTAGTQGGGFARAIREGALEGLRVGVPREMMRGLDADVERAVRDAMRRVEAKGASLRDVALPHVHHALAAYYVLNYAEFASAMQRLDGIRYGTHGADAESSRATFGDEVKRRILLGTFVTSREERGRWYDAALRVRAEVSRDFARALEECDVLMAPTMPMRAFRLGERIADPRAMYAADVLTVPANLAGVPAGSVPVQRDGLPIGLQVLGRPSDDRRVVSVMAEVERVL